MEIINTNKEAEIRMGDLVSVAEVFETNYYLVVVDREEQIFSLVSLFGFVAYTGFKSFEELQKETKCVLVAKNKDLKLSF
jgi:hypothetical protein